MMYTMIPQTREMNSLNRFLDEMFAPAMPRMRADVRETEGGYVIEAEMPGVEKENITLSLEEDVLTIRAEVKSESAEEKNDFLRRERVTGSMERAFSVEGIDQSAITADYRNGVLRVNLPRPAEEKKETRTIAIGDGE